MIIGTINKTAVYFAKPAKPNKTPSVSQEDRVLLCSIFYNCKNDW